MNQRIPSVMLVAIFSLAALLLIRSLAVLGQGTEAKIKPVTTKDPTTCFFCKYCASCHCGEKRKGNKAFDACSLNSLLESKPQEATLQDYPVAKAYLVPGKPEESLVWLRVQDESMPARGNKPSDDDKARFKTWIQGLPKGK